MEITNVYLAQQIMSVTLTTSAMTPNRNPAMFAKNLILYRGIDNTVKFQFKNNDQKKVAIHDKIITFNMIDNATHITYLTQTLTIVDGTNGIATLVISSSSLDDIKAQGYTWSIKVVDGEGVEHVGFTDDNYGARGELLLKDGIYPDFVESTSVTFTGDNVTSAVNAFPNLNNNTALHTAQIYFGSAYTGTITVQGTMDDVSNQNALNWFDIGSPISYTAQTDTTYTTWNGVFSGIRFQKADTTGTVSSILYRY